MIEPDQKRKEVLVERCPHCGETLRKGSLTSWIFRGPNTCDCQTNLSQGTSHGKQSVSKVSSGRSSSGRSSSSSGVHEVAPIELQNDKFLASRFRIGELIGAGGMGSVYKAEDASLTNKFAVKILRPELAKDPIACSRFEHEAKSISSLTHPNIVAVYEHGISQSGAPYIVMDYVEGVSLEKVMEDNVYLEPNRVIDLFIQVADAVEHAHKKRVIHRDIKPNNIMVKSVDGTDYAKIVDFGIAKVMPEANKTTQGLTQTGELFGSPSYMSPEQCTGKRLDGRSDIYSIGCVMYEALSGKPPFQGENAIQTILKHINDPPESLSKRSSNLNIPDELTYVVMRCLEKQPENRYQSANDLKADLESIRDGNPIKKIHSRRPVQSRPQIITSLSSQSGIYMLIATIALIGCLFAVSVELSRATNKGSALSIAETWAKSDILGQESFDRGDYKKAQEEFDNALEFAQSKNDSALLKASLNELLDLARLKGEKQDVSLLERRISDVQNEDSKHSGTLEKQLDDALAGRYDNREKVFFEDLANSANDQIASLSELDQSDTAKRVLDKTTKLVQAKLGLESEAMTRCLHNLAYLKHNVGDTVLAQKYYEEALALERKVIPREHVRTANTLLMMARLSLQQSNFSSDQVSKLLKESLSIYRHLSGPASKDVARVRYHLALLYFQTGRLDEAHAEVEAALNLFRSLKEPESTNIGRCYALLAAITQNSDDYLQAINLLERETNKDYRLMVITFIQYSRAISGDKPELAKSLLSRALAMSSRLRSPDRERTQWQIQYQLAQVNWLLGNREQSESAYKTSLTLAKGGFGENSEPVFDTLTGLATMHDDRGDVRQAKEFYERAVSLANQPGIEIAKAKREQLKFRFNHFLEKQTQL